ncbi:hypothetical protein FA13DRAFT_1730978 [Coprinellus micaceus]|uniref:Uncharacterized protein n=1 Tax=Coprinellus micaceus TaxID=71717 RepID=A0A4Y7TGB9_COPMI|nr:hypothetical protein FA13DRAFT_1730978 [Coprinellus micaceus]
MIPASVTKSLESFVPRWCRAAASRTITCILVRTPSCMEHGVLDVVPSWNQFHWHDLVPVPSFAALEVGRHPSMLAYGYALSPLLSPLTFISAYLFSSHALLTLLLPPYRPYYQRLCERWCRPTRPPAI